MISSVKKLQRITFEESKVAILPTDDYFTEENWDNYDKARSMFKEFLIFPPALLVLTLLIYWINTSFTFMSFYQD